MAGLCMAGGVLRPLVVEALRPVTEALVHGGLPAQAAAGATRRCLLTPFEGGRSTYNGFMIGAFLVVSSFLASFGIHR